MNAARIQAEAFLTSGFLFALGYILPAMWMMQVLSVCFVALVWIAQWLDWRAGLEHPSLGIRISHDY